MNPSLLKSMLKNFGIDPEEVQAKVEVTAKTAIAKIESIDQRLAAIEYNQKLLLACIGEDTLKAAHSRMEKTNGTAQPLPSIANTESVGTA